MAKNCIRFSSPIESSFDYYSKDIERTVFLNPLGYVKRNENDTNVKNPQSSIYTNNSNLFLGLPKIG